MVKNEMHFHGSVGSVQTGDNAVANVQMNTGVGLDEIAKLLSALQSQVVQLPAAEAQPVQAKVDEIKKELTGEKSPGKLKALAEGLTTAVTAAGGAATLVTYANQVAHWLAMNFPVGVF